MTKANAYTHYKFLTEQGKVDEAKQYSDKYPDFVEVEEVKKKDGVKHKRKT